MFPITDDLGGDPEGEFSESAAAGVAARLRKGVRGYA